MERKAINPWAWQDQFGFVQALEVSGAQRVLYTTDVDQLFGVYEVAAARLAAAGCRPSMTWLGVSRLAFPELMVEIEATAVR